MSMADLIAKFPDAEVIEKDELQYAEVGRGPWRLYVYNRSGYHSGGPWFRTGKMKYPDEEITFANARERTDKAIAAGLEVRICDGGDELVFHSENGQVLYGSTFWNEANPDPKAVKVASRLKGRNK